MNRSSSSGSKKSDPRHDNAEGESAVLAKIATMPVEYRAMGERLHEIIRESAPDLTTRLWYGMPAYTKDGKVICFFRGFILGKKVALFITHAMSSEAPPLMPILENCYASASSANTVGVFHCQGELDRALAEKLASIPDPKAQQFAATRPMTVGHPDHNDRAKARRFAEEIVAHFS